MKIHSILTIAGSDCSGGAGVQADVKTISAIGCYAASAITAVTVQNTLGVKDVFAIPAEVVKAQIEAVLNDLPIEAIKIGMVTDGNIIKMLTELLPQYPNIPVVFDPVLVSSNGYPLVEPKTLDIIRQALIPCCTLVTPNIPETEKLSGQTVTTLADMETAGRLIMQTGCKAVLIKGGHLSGNEKTDILLTGQNPTDIYRFNAKQINSSNTHGTGCTLSSAIAAYMALGLPLTEAVQEGKNFLTAAMESAQDIYFGHGHGPLNHFFNPKKLIIR